MPAPCSVQAAESDQQFYLTALREAYAVVEELRQKVGALLSTGDDVPGREATLGRCLAIIESGIIATTNRALKAIEAGTLTVETLTRDAGDSVTETIEGLRRILGSDPRLELFAGATGAALKAEFDAALDRVSRINLRDLAWPA